MLYSHSNLYSNPPIGYYSYGTSARVSPNIYNNFLERQQAFNEKHQFQQNPLHPEKINPLQNKNDGNLQIYQKYETIQDKIDQYYTIIPHVDENYLSQPDDPNQRKKKKKSSLSQKRKSLSKSLNRSQSGNKYDLPDFNIPEPKDYSKNKKKPVKNKPMLKEEIPESEFEIQQIYQLFKQIDGHCKTCHAALLKIKQEKLHSLIKAMKEDAKTKQLWKDRAYTRGAYTHEEVLQRYNFEKLIEKLSQKEPHQCLKLHSYNTVEDLQNLYQRNKSLRKQSKEKFSEMQKEVFKNLDAIPEEVNERLGKFDNHMKFCQFDAIKNEMQIVAKEYEKLKAEEELKEFVQFKREQYERKREQHTWEEDVLDLNLCYKSRLINDFQPLLTKYKKIAELEKQKLKEEQEKEQEEKSQSNLSGVSSSQSSNSSFSRSPSVDTTEKVQVKKKKYKWERRKKFSFNNSSQSTIILSESQSVTNKDENQKSEQNIKDKEKDNEKEKEKAEAIQDSAQQFLEYFDQELTQTYFGQKKNENILQYQKDLIEYQQKQMFKNKQNGNIFGKPHQPKLKQHGLESDQYDYLTKTNKKTIQQKHELNYFEHCRLLKEQQLNQEKTKFICQLNLDKYVPLETRYQKYLSQNNKEVQMIDKGIQFENEQQISSQDNIIENTNEANQQILQNNEDNKSQISSKSSLTSEQLDKLFAFNKNDPIEQQAMKRFANDIRKMDPHQLYCNEQYYKQLFEKYKIEEKQRQMLQNNQSIWNKIHNYQPLEKQQNQIQTENQQKNQQEDIETIKKELLQRHQQAKDELQKLQHYTYCQGETQEKRKAMSEQEQQLIKEIKILELQLQNYENQQQIFDRYHKSQEELKQRMQAQRKSNLKDVQSQNNQLKNPDQIDNNLQRGREKKLQFSLTEPQSFLKQEEI